MEKEEIQVRVEKYFDDLHATMWGQAYNLYDSVSRPLGVKYRAVVMAAPACIAVSKLMEPETEEAATAGETRIDIPRIDAQLTHTAVTAAGAVRAEIYVDGVRLADVLSVR